MILNEVVNSQDKVSLIFAALADPTRRRLLVRLSTNGEAPVTTLAEPFRVSAPAISRHLRVLENARLIGRRRAGRVHLIRARKDGLKPAQDWMAQCAAGWDFSFDKLEGLLENAQKKGKK
jgi:DNA-binding transcriptional ArsR family regulator